METFCYLVAQLCRADGPVSPAEIAFLDNAFVQELELDERETAEARDCFRRGKTMDLDVESASREVCDAFGGNEKCRDDLAFFLLNLARSDGPLRGPETGFLKIVFKAFGYSASQIETLIGSSEEPSSDDGISWQRALELLELQEGFSKEELLAARRTKVKEFHPDTLMSLSLGLRKLAEEQMKEINLAYTKLKTAFPC